MHALSVFIRLGEAARDVEMSDLATDAGLSPEILKSYRLLRDECGRVDLPDRRMVELVGDDAIGWLQGQATNDLRNLQPGAYLNFCLCKPTGQIEAVCSLWVLEGRTIVMSDSAGIEVLLDRLQKFVILERVTATRPDVQLIFIQGPMATSYLGEFIALPQLNCGTGTVEGVDVTVLRSNKTGSGGWVVVVPNEANAVVSHVTKGLGSISREAYRIACLEFGTPAMGIDIDSKVLPPELGKAFESAHINYKKGCYMGQEVLMRIYSRGHTNRTWMGLFTASPVAPGDTITHSRRGEAGVITNFAESPDMGYIAAGFIRREVAYNGELVQVQTAQGPVEAEIQHMPLLELG